MYRFTVIHLCTVRLYLLSAGYTIYLPIDVAEQYGPSILADTRAPQRQRFRFYIFLPSILTGKSNLTLASGYKIVPPKP